MKKIAMMILAAAFAGSVSATTYNDNTGDTFFGGIMDIVSVEVMNDLNDISFAITMNGDVQAANWGSFMIGVDSVTPGGSTTTAWSGRPITFGASNPIDYWMGSWNAGAGSQGWQWNGATWDADPAPGISVVGNTVTFTTTLANMGLSPNDTFFFDVFSSGDVGDPGAVDSLANPSQTIADWTNPYVANTVYQYTVVPEPASAALLALGGLVVAIFRRRLS